MRRIKQLRAELGVTQAELAHLAGVVVSTISNVETGFVDKPMPLTLRAIATCINRERTKRGLSPIRPEELVADVEG